MTRNDFLALCEKHTVAPALALEDDDIRAALSERDDAAVERLITEKF